MAFEVLQLKAVKKTESESGYDKIGVIKHFMVLDVD